MLSPFHWRNLWLLLFVVWGLAQPHGQDLVAYYVDPDYAGATRNGQAATPWQSLSDTITNTPWTVIDTALAASDVVVYFSARAAGSDVDETSTVGINTARTSTSTFRLTLDGGSKYNTNDTTPSWTPYPSRTKTLTLGDGRVITGKVYNGSRYAITGETPCGTTVAVGARHRFTQRFFRCISNSSQALYHWGGNDVTYEDLEITHTGSPGNGPGYFTVGVREEGQMGACVQAVNGNCGGFDGPSLYRSYVHNTFGETVYLGGCANSPCDSIGIVPNSGYLLEDNVIVNPATLGGEGDNIDIKDNIDNVTVRGNILIQYGADIDRDCIETMSGGTYEQNYLEGCGRIGISLATVWNTNDDASRAGTIIRNNFIVKMGATTPPTYSYGAGIVCWDDSPAGPDVWSGLLIDHNTIFGSIDDDSPNDGEGIYLLHATLCPSVTVRNNLVWDTEGRPGRFISGTLGTHSDNLFFRTGGGTVVTDGASNYTAAQITTFEASGLSEDPSVVSEAAPYTDANFKIQTGSVAKDAGVTITGLTSDYFTITRPQGSAPDIGAHEFTTGALPAPPTGVTP